VRRGYLLRAGLQPPRGSAADLHQGRGVAATLSQQQVNLDAARQALTQADLDAVADLLLGARRILVVSAGNAEVAGTLLVRLLRHVGLNGEVVSSSAVELALAVHDLTSADVVVAINLWIPYRETLRALRLARRLGAHTVALANSRQSALSEAAERVLVAPSQGEQLVISVVAAVAVVEAIVAAIATRRPEQTAVHYQALHQLYTEEDLLAPMARVNPGRPRRLPADELHPARARPRPRKIINRSTPDLPSEK
jgi:DNA-binding MurR/RpiR family transcriptional regulator